MKKTLSILERIVIESLNKSPKDLIILSNDTGIGMKVLSNIVKELISVNFIFESHNLYKINKLNIQEWMNADHNYNSHKNELRNMFDLVVSNYKLKNKNQDDNLRLQKVYLTYEEERIYNEHLSHLDNFIKQVTRNRKADVLKFETKKERVIYWGHTEYSNLIDEALA